MISHGAVRRGSPVQFFQETIAELRKCVWPTREETLRLTYIVILLSSAMMLFLWGLDQLLNQTFGKYILR